jgi:4-aminobutyrate aminotransferase-like enzyme
MVHPSLGHCHPKVVKAAQEQVGNLIHGQVRKYELDLE